MIFDIMNFVLSFEVMYLRADVIIKGTLVGKYTVEIEAGDHRIYFDLPQEKGGDGKGPTPIHGLLASIAGCIGIIGRTISERLGITIESMEITVKGWYDPAAIVNPNIEATVNDIEVMVKVKSPESEEKIRELIKEVERACFVVQSLVKERPVKVFVEKI